MEFMQVLVGVHEGPVGSDFEFNIGVSASAGAFLGSQAAFGGLHLVLI